MRKKGRHSLRLLSYAVTAWLALPTYTVWADDGAGGRLSTEDIHVEVDAAQEEAKVESQQKTIITKEDIEKKQAKSVEDIIFSETGVSRTVDAMGRVGISIRGAEPRHTLILVDGQPVLGDLAKYSGAADEVMRLGTENVERIEIVQGAASAKYGSDAIGGVVNIITRKAAKEPGLQFNVEGLRKKGDSGLQFSNFFLRADSGQMGKLRVGLSGSKRDIVPVYASVHRQQSGLSFDYSKRDFRPTALRYYGDTASIGLVGTYDADTRNSFEFRVDRYSEDLIRDVKRTDSDLEPQQHFKRKTGRNAYNVGWKGFSNTSDWNIEMNYTNLREDDVSLINYEGKTVYEGKNELRYVDNVDHRQFDFKASMNTQLGDKHLLSYGFGFSNEKGEGSRLKSSPNTSTRHIDPWDYDKSLLVDKQDRLIRGEDQTNYVWSHIHDYAFSGYDHGIPQWNKNYEYYYYDANRPGSINPGLTYEDFTKYDLKRGDLTQNWAGKLIVGGSHDITDIARPNLLADYNRLKDQLRAQNPGHPITGSIVTDYYTYGIQRRADAPKLNGKAFLEEYWERDQRITVGSGTIKKQNFFIGDTWQLSKNTMLFPIVRLDHSNLFGTNVSGSLGVTHNVGGNAHRRFKANVGTSYAEPGMGELWYNWEMYGSNPIGIGVAKMGWWWAGNPDLKPEKSVNIDMSLEGETKNTFARVGLFHNRIRDYMTVYFTGKFMDFAPQLGASAKWMRAPDMIYSFKNIGRAEITGLEAEVRQKIGPHFNARLGYTYLHAINKSDPLMPRRLLDRPQHKVDIGISYEDQKTGWGAQLWGDYYIHMLDSNTLANRKNYWPDILDGTGVNEQHVYQEKTFGIWNFLLQKKLSDDAMVYVGVNNIFNHRDDDRATQERVYRLGANFKFDTGGTKNSRLTGGATPMGKEEAAVLEGFLRRPFDVNRSIGVFLIGDYQLRWNAHGGTNRPRSTYTPDSFISADAAKNMADADGHGFEQRIRIGADARVGKNTNIKVVGSMTGTPGVDPAHSLPDSKGMGKQRLEEADVTQHAKRWDLSLGRLTEPMGVTGYYFGREYDGVRAVYTGKSTQVRLGYGTFKHSTGVSDTAYTHATNAVFYRPPTIVEFLGINYADHPTEFDRSIAQSNDEYRAAKAAGQEAQTKNLYFYQQLKDVEDSSASTAEKAAKKLDIIKRMHSIVKAAYGKDMERAQINLDPGGASGAAAFYEVQDAAGNKSFLKVEDSAMSYSGYISDWDSAEDKAYKRDVNRTLALSLADGSALRSDDAYIRARATDIESAYQKIAEHGIAPEFNDYARGTWPTPRWQLSGGTWTQVPGSSAPVTGYRRTGRVFLAQKTGTNTYANGLNAARSLYENNYVTDSASAASDYGLTLNNVAFEYLRAMQKVVEASESENKLPRTSLGNVVGNLIRTEGMVLERDYIPPIDKAFFLQIKHQFSANFGLAAWYLRSVGGKNYIMQAANGRGNDSRDFSHLADVIGLGAQWQMGKQTALSFDYGQNRTAFGKYMNGETVFEHRARTDVFTPRGRSDGSAPIFWTMRLTIGNADTDRRGSWNAFIDYKHFEHGAFFGGNGTGYLPDRYLDGIHSFTVGGGYVPARNWLVELFYTFDAKGTNQRDTLHGPEKFKLGNYTRFQLTYRF